MVQPTEMRWQIKGALKGDLNRKQHTGKRANKWSVVKPEQKTTLGKNGANSLKETGTRRVS